MRARFVISRTVADYAKCGHTIGPECTTGYWRHVEQQLARARKAANN